MKYIHTLAKSLRKAKLSKSLLIPTLLVVIFISALTFEHHSKVSASHAELSYLDHSPRGATGGSVMPASCDSFPRHSTCACTIVGQTSTASCPIFHGTGSLTITCIASGGDLLLSNGPCVAVSCDAGYDEVSDWYGTYCKANCTGIQHRVMGTESHQTGCNQWCQTKNGCAINKTPDTKIFASNDGLYISRAHALVCIDPIYSNVPIAGCADCPVGTTPDANHVSCVGPAQPSVNVNFENVYPGGGGDNGGGN